LSSSIGISQKVSTFPFGFKSTVPRLTTVKAPPPTVSKSNLVSEEM
jgi:hypothetical protein